MRSPRKHEILTRPLRKMERTLDTVLRSLGNPTLAAGLMSPSPSPSLQAKNTQALINTPSPPGSPAQHHPHHAPTSPKLPSLPEDALNPLGLLAEASLANRRAQASAKATSTAVASNEDSKVGVASDVYFKPGRCLNNPNLCDGAPSSQNDRTYDDPAIAAVVHRTADTA